MTHLYKRGKIYYFRIAVPKTLRELIGQREILKSLHTHYYDLARQLARPLLRHVELLFAAIRSGCMTQEQIKGAIAAFIKQQETRGSFDFISYVGKLDRAYYDKYYHLATFSPEEKIPSYEHIRKSILSKLANYDTAGMEHAAEKVFGIKPSDDGYTQACLTLLAFDAEQYKTLIEMAQGDMTTFNAIRERYLDTPASPPPAVADQLPPQVHITMPATIAQPTYPTKKLSEAIKLYIKKKTDDKSWDTKTAYENKKMYDVLLFVAEDIEMSCLDDQEFAQEIIGRITKTPKNMGKKAVYANLNIHQILALPDPEPLSTDRINKYFEYMSALVTFSIKARWLTINHFNDCKIKKKRGHKASSERDQYETEDIKSLLAGLQTVFNKSEPEKLWIATLMLFHGCRPADLVRITKAQFETKRGILCMNLSSKTEAGVRTVPVHPFVLDCDFERFLATIPEGGKLWSDNLKFYEAKDADSHERWYNRTFEPRHVTDADKKSLYSLRHSFITNLKHADVMLFMVKAIVGHEKGLPEEDITFDRYGKEYTPEKMLVALKILDYKVDLEPFRQFCRSIQW